MINRFLTAGITLSGASADDNIIEGNFIGTNAGGTTDLGNAESGIAVNGASNNLIGGSQPSARNLIAGNGTAGVLIFSTVVGVTASANIVEGNYIGTDATGTAALGNAEDGVRISIKASDNFVGGAAAGAGNLISGNVRNGVYITDLGGGSSGGSNRVQGNLIGTDAAGAAALGNVENGIFIENRLDNTIGGTVAGAGNVISANGLENSLTSSNGILIMGERSQSAVLIQRIQVTFSRSLTASSST